jgi:type II secretory pathway component GspD/PulD (secretin)
MTNVGTLIAFTALVQDDGSILAELDIEKSRLDETPRQEEGGVAGGGTGDGAVDGNVEPPRTVTIKIQTTVRIPEGQTVIVSGMRESTSGDSSEALVLVTARVLDSPSAVGSQPAATDTTRVVKIFSLRTTRAHEAAEFLHSLFGEGPMKVAADERTNSVLVSGDDKEVQKVEAILLRLDETPT